MLHRVILASVDSTNKYVEDRKQHLPLPSLVIAYHQRRGRGQGSNRWDAQRGDITFTLYTELHELTVTSFFVLSQIVSLEIVDFLREYAIFAQIKWPNDILVGLEKIAGILIQTHIEGGVFRSATVGVGLNVVQRLKSPAHYQPPATAMCNLQSSISIDSIDASEQLANRILTAIKDYGTEKAQQIRARYWEQMFRNQGLHPFLIHGEHRLAQIVSVCDNGLLHLQDELGEEYHCGFKDIRFLF